MNMKEFALKCGISKNMPSYLETHGKAFPSKALSAICEATHTRVDWLLRGEGEMFPEGPPEPEKDLPPDAPAAQPPDNGSGGGMPADHANASDESKAIAAHIAGQASGPQAAAARTCRVCGCTDDHACEGGCYWVEADLCSKCAEKCAAQLTPGVKEAVLASVDTRVAALPLNILEIEYLEVRKRGGGFTESAAGIKVGVDPFAGIGASDEIYARAVEWVQQPLDNTVDTLEADKLKAAGELHDLQDKIREAGKELRQLIDAKTALQSDHKPMYTEQPA
jgi:hypothetical protein